MREGLLGIVCSTERTQGVTADEDAIGDKEVGVVSHIALAVEPSHHLGEESLLLCGRATRAKL